MAMEKIAKIYDMNGCDWWCDYSVEEAKKNYLKFTGADPLECLYDDESIVALSNKELKQNKYKPYPYEEPNTELRTFEEELKIRVQQGDVPSFFASTEF